MTQNRERIGKIKMMINTRIYRANEELLEQLATHLTKKKQIKRKKNRNIV